MARVYLDFEYNKSQEENLNPICVSFMIVGDPDIPPVTENVWLQNNPQGTGEFKEVMQYAIGKGYTFVAFYAAAEARSLLSLGIDPRSMKWVCLWIEYRMLMNNNQKFECGRHLIKGKVVNIKPNIPKWARDNDYKPGGVAEVSLVSCCYKMLGEKIDSKHKDEMRDLILSKNEFSDQEKTDIMIYCESDIVHLPKLHKIIYKELYKKYSKFDRKHLIGDMFIRGEYAAATAIMESKGYPIDQEATRSFADSVKHILFEMQKEVLENFPEVQPFLINKTGTAFVQKQSPIRKWVQAQNHHRWLKTDKGETSLSLEAFEKFYSSHSDQEIFGNAFVKYLRSKQAFNGFMPPKKNKKTIWDSLGEDYRVRPYFGIFRAQTGRSQPSATSYILLKAKWMRSLIQPKPGRAIIGIDYSQQEFLLAGLLSQDSNMIAAYMSGDPYLHTAKLAKAIPMNGKREDHETIRDKFKSTVLGIQFGMAAPGLSDKLTTDLGIPYTEEDAQGLIDMFNNSYPDYEEYRHKLWGDYQEEGYIRLKCGWTMFGDNPNKRSVCNMPIQGTGASIMRKAVLLAQGETLDVIMTLHDALYVECDIKYIYEAVNTLHLCMAKAFQYYFIGTSVEFDAVCRMDPSCWGPDLGGQSFITKMGDMICYPKYIDPRGREDYKKYRKYFVPFDELTLLTSM